MRFFTLLAVISSFISFAVKAQTGRNIPYVEADNPEAHERHVMDIYVPPNPVSEALPVVLFIHGGAWQSGSKGAAGDFFSPLVNSGKYVVADMNYRLSQHAIFPAQIHDVKAAIRFLKANAETYNIDPDRFAVAGSSAGGHLANLAGTSFGVTDLEGSQLGNAMQSSEVDAVLDVFGPTDFLTTRDHFYHVINEGICTGNPEQFGQEGTSVADFLGCPLDDCPETAVSASPITYVDSDEPPFMIMHGLEDCTVPYPQSEQLRDLLLDNNIPVEAHFFEGVGHEATHFQQPNFQRQYMRFFDDIFYEDIPCEGLPASVGFTPIPDLGTGTWNGWQGGLYPNGQNDIPDSHAQKGLTIAQNLQKLDSEGLPDDNGKLVFMSVGMSNGLQEFEFWEENVLDTFQNLNPELTLVNGAQGGVDINKMLGVDNGTPEDAAEHLSYIRRQLEQAGATAAQVQVIWIKQAERVPTEELENIEELRQKFTAMLQMLKSEFPSLKMAYFSSRSYGGYNPPGRGTPEPYAYYQGWAVKKVIEDQINGNEALHFEGENPIVPWIAWGPYLWADGLTPRSDGLFWACEDFVSDGVHPSEEGNLKISQLLQKFFSEAPTATPWFLESQNSSPTALKEGIIAELGLKIYPNPSQSHAVLESDFLISEIEIFNLSGKLLLRKEINAKRTTLDMRHLPRGLFLLKTREGGVLKVVK